MISVEHLTKDYSGHVAVDDISFEITEGHVYGFLGPNGAGKSTTMNILTGCLSASAGRVSIDGHDIFEEPDKAKRLIGYLPEHPPLYLNESPLEYLRFVGEAKGLRGRELAAQVQQAMERTGITGVQNRRISALSKGYRQRVGIAQALLGNPRVIILDEPTVGLDPIQIMEIRDLIRELGKSHTVIFSSHILSEVQAICDRILMIAHGRLVAFGEPEELQRALLAHSEIVLSTDADEQETRDILASVEGVEELTLAPEEQQTRASLRCGSDALRQTAAAVFRAFAASGRVLYEMSLKKGNLEDVFLELSEETPEETPDENEAPATEAAAEEQEVEQA